MIKNQKSSTGFDSVQKLFIMSMVTHDFIAYDRIYQNQLIYQQVLSMEIITSYKPGYNITEMGGSPSRKQSSEIGDGREIEFEDYMAYMA